MCKKNLTMNNMIARYKHSIIILVTSLLFVSWSCSDPVASESLSSSVVDPTPERSSSVIVPILTASTTPQLLASYTPAPTKTAFHLDLPFTSSAAVIGRSVAGNALEVYRYGNGPVELLIVAGMHGGSEANTTQLAYELMNYIQEHPEIIPADVTLFILPCLNPDGAARSQDANGRVNNNGVDLNRNWDANWQSEWLRDGCWNQGPSTAGDHAMSEPETIALSNFIRSHDFHALLNYHSAGLGIFAGGQPPTDTSLNLASTISAVSPYPYPPVDTGCLYTGGFIDWAANQGIAALDIELSNHIGTDFEVNLSILKAFLAWRGTD